MLAALEDLLNRDGGEVWPVEELHFLPAERSACINGGESLRLRKLIPQCYITTHGSLRPPPLPSPTLPLGMIRIITERNPSLLKGGGGLKKGQ